MNAKKFTKKPVEIEAIQYDGSNFLEIKRFTNDTATKGGKSDWVTIPTLEGEHIATIGDWIIKGVKGEFYPCKPDIFELTYIDSLATHTNSLPTEKEIVKASGLKEVDIGKVDSFVKDIKRGEAEKFIEGAKWAISQSSDKASEGEEWECKCKEDETTGCTTQMCCNNCGKIVNDPDYPKPPKQ